jgi:hypothetical protein
MTKERKRCLAKLKNGHRCPNAGKPEYHGHCGIHRNNAQLHEVESGKTLDERLARLLTVGSALVLLTEKAITYLPAAIQILVEASKVLFVKPADETLVEEPEKHSPNFGLKDPADNELVSMSISPKELASKLDFLVQKHDWQLLANDLAYDFDLKVTCGNVPASLLEEIMRAKAAIQKELRDLGYKPSDFTANRPVYIPTKS